MSAEPLSRGPVKSRGQDMLIRALEFYCGIGMCVDISLAFRIANVWSRWTAPRSLKEQRREQRDRCPRF